MKKVIHSPNAPQAAGPYSQAIQTARLIFVSGQLPIDPATGALVEGIEAQTRQSLRNLQAILQEAGQGMNAVVKTTVLLADMGDFAAMNGIYAEFFTADMPARVCYQVAGLPMGARVEIDAIACAK